MESVIDFMKRIRDRYASMTVYSDFATQAVKANDSEGLEGIVRRFTSVFIRGHTFCSERYIVADGVDWLSQVVIWHKDSGNLWSSDTQWRRLHSLEKVIRLSQLITAKLLVPSLFEHPFFAFNTVHRVKEDSIDGHSCDVLEIDRLRDTIHIWVDKHDLIIRRIDHILCVSGIEGCLRRLDYKNVYAH